MAVRERFDFEGFCCFGYKVHSIHSLSVAPHPQSAGESANTVSTKERGEGGVHQDSSLTSQARQ